MSALTYVAIYSYRLFDSNTHAVPCCQVSVHHFHASKVLHSLGYLNAHVHQLFTHYLNLNEITERLKFMAIPRWKLDV